jgi:hydroxypyruvate reductase
VKSRDELKQVAIGVFEAGLRAVDPVEAVRRHVWLRSDGALVIDGPGVGSSTSTLGPGADFERVVVVGAGKASARMCQAVEAILGDRVEGGLVVVKSGHAVPTERVEVVEASHPVPDERGLVAARRIAEVAREADAATLVVVLVSGGGSALLALPAEGISLDEKREVTDLMLAAGADISELNTVRKHLSAIKGGWLARLASPARVISLVLSDVVGDRLEVIASGPTAPDATTFADAEAVLLRRCGGRPRLVPAAVWSRLERGRRGELEETPKPGDECFDGVLNVVIGSNAAALAACCADARARGLDPLLLSSTVEGEAREVARVLAAMAGECRRSGSPARPPACLVSGGETTVTVRGPGRGGRNQELALGAALAIRGLEGVAILAAGTDGTDGPTDAAGAIAFGDTLARARDLGLDPRAHLDANDSYRFFDALGDLLRTGPTGTNVMDIHLVLVDEA